MRRERVLALLNDDDVLWERQRAGMLRCCRLHGWELRAVKLGRDGSRVRSLVQFVKPLGVLSSLWFPIHRLVPARCPVVYFDCPASVAPPTAPHIRHDARVTAHLAVSELFALKCRAYAYVAFCEPSEWSDEREQFFGAEIASRGGVLLPTFRPPETRDLKMLVPAFAAWVRTLPKRSGVFCANDKMAEATVRACATAGLRIPADIAVVGVDNEEPRCLSVSPSITSVIPDWEGCGFRALSALDDLIHGKVDQARHVFLPLGIARRETTGRQFVRGNPTVVDAVGYIREHACEGLRARDVIARMKCSRRLAELRFRETTGSSILEEIRRVRFENARQLLSHTSTSVNAVANRCGYASVATFCREFRRETDMSPEDWRRKG